MQREPYMHCKTGWLFQLYSGYPSCTDSGYVSLSKQICSFDYTVVVCRQVKTHWSLHAAKIIQRGSWPMWVVAQIIQRRSWPMWVVVQIIQRGRCPMWVAAQIIQRRSWPTWVAAQIIQRGSWPTRVAAQIIQRGSQPFRKEVSPWGMVTLVMTEDSQMFRC